MWQVNGFFDRALLEQSKCSYFWPIISCVRIRWCDRSVLSSSDIDFRPSGVHMPDLARPISIAMQKQIASLQSPVVLSYYAQHRQNIQEHFFFIGVSTASHSQWSLVAPSEKQRPLNCGNSALVESWGQGWMMHRLHSMTTAGFCVGRLYRHPTGSMYPEVVKPDFGMPTLDAA